jgi:signal peptidase I
MEPFLYPGDMFLVSNTTSFNGLSNGDVIIFQKPSNISVTIVARIIDIRSDSVGSKNNNHQG